MLMNPHIDAAWEKPYLAEKKTRHAPHNPLRKKKGSWANAWVCLPQHCLVSPERAGLICFPSPALFPQYAEGSWLGHWLKRKKTWDVSLQVEQFCSWLPAGSSSPNKGRWLIFTWITAWERRTRLKIKVASTGQNTPKNRNYSHFVLWGIKNK